METVARRSNTSDEGGALRPRIARRWLVLAIAFVGVCFPGAGSPAGATCGWIREPSPNPSSRWNLLEDIDVLGPNAAWAVGRFVGGDVRPLVLHWNGTVWSQRLVDDLTGLGPAHFFSVSARSNHDVWAVGVYLEYVFDQTRQVPLIMHWDGSTWTRMPAPYPSRQEAGLDGVAVIPGTDDVVAVGSRRVPYEVPHTYVVRFDGTEWTRDKAPSPGLFHDTLHDVTALSSSDMWAVGSSDGIVAPFFDRADRPLALHWNGTRWKEHYVPPVAATDTDLRGVDAISTENAMAVGKSGDQAYAARLDGRSWTRMQLPDLPGAALEAVDMRRGSDAWAVGSASGESLIEHWDGSAWSVFVGPTPGGEVLNGIDSSRDEVWAVGHGGRSVRRTMVDRYTC